MYVKKKALFTFIEYVTLQVFYSSYKVLEILLSVATDFNYPKIPNEAFSVSKKIKVLILDSG